MKRKLLFAGAFILITWAFTSCDALKTCKTCKKVYYDGTGAYLREDGEAEYCDAMLLAIEGKTIDLGDLGSAKWECR
jgi:hypothetical protein